VHIRNNRFSENLGEILNVGLVVSRDVVVIAYFWSKAHHEFLGWMKVVDLKLISMTM